MQGVVVVTQYRYMYTRRRRQNGGIFFLIFANIGTCIVALCLARLESSVTQQLNNVQVSSSDGKIQMIQMPAAVSAYGPMFMCLAVLVQMLHLILFWCCQIPQEDLQMHEYFEAELS